MRHHFQDHRYGFGVSSPLWDAVFRTLPRHPASLSAPARAGQLQLEAGVGIVELLAEQLAQAGDPVARGLRVDVQLAPPSPPSCRRGGRRRARSRASVARAFSVSAVERRQAAGRDPLGERAARRAGAGRRGGPRRAAGRLPASAPGLEPRAAPRGPAPRRPRSSASGAGRAERRGPAAGGALDLSSPRPGPVGVGEQQAARPVERRWPASPAAAAAPARARSRLGAGERGEPARQRPARRAAPRPAGRPRPAGGSRTSSAASSRRRRRRTSSTSAWASA